MAEALYLIPAWFYGHSILLIAPASEPRRPGLDKQGLKKTIKIKMANEAPPPAASVATVSKCHSQSIGILNVGSIVVIDIDV